MTKSLLLLFFFVLYCFPLYLKGRAIEIFSLLAHSSATHNSHNWARAKPAIKNSIWVFHSGGRNPSP